MSSPAVPIWLVRGTSSADHVEENVAVARVELSEEEEEEEEVERLAARR